jgi:Na+-transporting NADH:ubiquinone oxidoreductase subunit NqrB
MSRFQQAKLEIVATLGLAKDALHVHAGLALMIGACLLFRLRLSDWRPLALVVAAALAGEAWDLLDASAAGEPLLWANSAKDFANTLFWPLVLFLLARGQERAAG